MAACENVERQAAAWAQHDWASVDFEACGLATPQQLRPGEAPSTARLDPFKPLNPPGYSDDTPGWISGWPDSMDNGGGRAGFCGGPRFPLGQGYNPNEFGAAHDPFFLNVLCHPQMLRLHRMMLGPEIRFDHNSILNKPGGAGFGGWHPHNYPGDPDNTGVSSSVHPLQVITRVLFPLFSFSHILVSVSHDQRASLAGRAHPLLSGGVRSARRRRPRPCPWGPPVRLSHA